ncbi:MAG: hypothetical protein NVS2B3_09510 [Vulcanimicrobiaceae bacterium]
MKTCEPATANENPFGLGLGLGLELGLALGLAIGTGTSLSRATGLSVVDDSRRRGSALGDCDGRAEASGSGDASAPAARPGADASNVASAKKTDVARSAMPRKVMSRSGDDERVCGGVKPCANEASIVVRAIACEDSRAVSATRRRLHTKLPSHDAATIPRLRPIAPSGSPSHG